VLTIRGLRKTYSGGRRASEDVQALDSVDLHVPRGAFATVLGPSGCGKTTLLRAIAGFEIPDAGTIEIAGESVVSRSRVVSAHDRGVGIVPQDGALFPHLSVAQNVGFGLTGPRRRRNHRVGEVLELVGLGGLQARRPHELSGGQQQRVALARAIAPNPQLVLLDEPFSALDALLRESLREEVRDLLRSIGATVVLVTHDQAEALTLGDHLVVMRNGRVVQAGSPRDTYQRPNDAELARFLGDAVLVPGEIVATGATPCVDCPLGVLPVGAWHGAAGACAVLIRPESITIAARDGVGDGVAGAVVGQSFFGHDQLIEVAVPGVPETVAVRALGGVSFATDQRVRLCVTSPVCTFPPDASTAHSTEALAGA